MNNNEEYELNFTDITICQTDGIFSEIKEIMSSEPPGHTDWVIRTSLTIDGPIGVAGLTLQLDHQAKIFIIEYQPSVGDVYYNPDLQVLSLWAQERGWQIPEPLPSLVKGNVDFWRHYWQTLLVDSSYLDETFGKRETLRSEQIKEAENERANDL